MAHIQVFTEKRRSGPLGLRKRTQYRWRVVARNGRIMATSGEGYHNIGDLWHAVREVTNALGGALGRSIPIHEGPPSN